MENRLSYEGFIIELEFDIDSRLYYGVVEGVNIEVEARTITDFNLEFRNKINEYLEGLQSD